MPSVVKCQPQVPCLRVHAMSQTYSRTATAKGPRWSRQSSAGCRRGASPRCPGPCNKSPSALAGNGSARWLPEHTYGSLIRRSVSLMIRLGRAALIVAACAGFVRASGGGGGTAMQVVVQAWAVEAAGVFAGALCCLSSSRQVCKQARVTSTAISAHRRWPVPA